MKSVRLHGIRDLRVSEELIPTAAPGEVLICVTSVGICGSDIHWYVEGTTGTVAFDQPFVLGHEFAGVIVNGELDGKGVAVEPTIPCGQCEFCRQGNPNLCPYHFFAGQAPQDGALREFMTWPARNVFPIPDTITSDEAAMLEPLGVALHSTDLGKIRIGMKVGVYGCGPIGLLIIQLAKLSGAARIIATDKLDHRLQVALEMGATEVFSASDHQEIPSIIAVTEGRGVDVAFEVAGEQAAVETAVESCKPGGRVIICGIPVNDLTSFKASTARRKGLTIKIVRRMKHTYPRAIDLVDRGMVDVKSIITHRYALDQCSEAFSFAESRRGLKVVVNP